MLVVSTGQPSGDVQQIFPSSHALIWMNLFYLMVGVAFMPSQLPSLGLIEILKTRLSPRVLWVA